MISKYYIEILNTYVDIKIHNLNNVKRNKNIMVQGRYQLLEILDQCVRLGEQCEDISQQF